MKIKKFFAVASAVVMMLTATTVPAMAAVPNISTSTTCSICNQAFTKYGGGSTFPETETLTYQDLFSSSDIDSLVNSEKYSYDGSVEYKGNHYQLFVAEYNGSEICFSCLESKVNEVNQGSTIPDAGGTHTGSTNLTASVASGYIISIPQSVILSGSSDGSGTKSATIPVLIKGDIAEEANVVVTTEAPIMKRAGSKDVTATVTEPDKTTWSRTACTGDGTKRNYIVSADLTPGDWKGTMTFNCSLGVLTEVNFGIACL